MPPGATSATSRSGAVLAVMPWNFPLWQAMRFAAPALMAGNVGLLKHASNVPQTALYMQELFERAGFPAGVVPDPADRLGPGRAGAARPPGGGGHADRQRGRRPGGRPRSPGRDLKKTVLELGGSDAFVVMPSADLDKAAQVATTARCQNNGQSCIAAKRFIVHADVYDEFAGRVRQAACRRWWSATRWTRRPTSARWPPSRAGDDVAEQVADAVAKGAHGALRRRADRPAGLVLPADRGRRPHARTCGCTPRRCSGRSPALYRVGSYDEAIELANGTEFGLGSNAWTTDPDEQAALRHATWRPARCSSTA